MRHRNPRQGPEENRPSRPGREALPDYDEHGLHGDDRRQYRGRESYEQQSRGGEAGRSGMWDQRHIAPDQDTPSRNDAGEDWQGYRNTGTRDGFEGRQGRRRDYDLRSPAVRREPRYGFDPQDYPGDPWDREDYGTTRDDYSRTDYGRRGYGQRDPREGGQRGRDFRDFRSPYAGRPSYEDRAYTPGPYSSYGQRGSGSWSEQDFEPRRHSGSPYDAVRQPGRGPKGYKRSDDRIREDVCDRLSQQWDLDASEVEVTVSDGEVTLLGTIADRDQKFRIERLADSVAGVHDVHNQLRLRRDGGTQSSSGTTSSTRGGSTHNSRSS